MASQKKGKYLRSFHASKSCPRLEEEKRCQCSIDTDVIGDEGYDYI